MNNFLLIKIFNKNGKFIKLYIFPGEYFGI